MSEILLTSKGDSTREYLRKVYQFRSLTLTLARRDLKVQYAQTFLGLLWSVIQPLTSLLVWTIFFDKLIKVDTANIPYPLFAFSGMIGWYYFTNIFNNAGTSLVNSQDLIRKIYFPRIILPISKVLVGFFEFAISLILLFLMILITGHKVSWLVVFLPFFILLNIITGLAFGLWLSALTIRYRDFQHIIPFFIYLGIWLTPVFYPSTLIPDEYDMFIYVNPIAAVIAGYRWSLLGGEMLSPYYAISFVLMVFILITGFIFFRKNESTIADYI